MLNQQITHLIYCTLHFKNLEEAVKCHPHSSSLSQTRPASVSRVCQTLVIIYHNANVKNILHFSKRTRHFFEKIIDFCLYYHILQRSFLAKRPNGAALSIRRGCSFVVIHHVLRYWQTVPWYESSHKARFWRRRARK